MDGLDAISHCAPFFPFPRGHFANKSKNLRERVKKSKNINDNRGSRPPRPARPARSEESNSAEPMRNLRKPADA